MRYAVIENGIVTNIALGGEGFTPPDNWHEISEPVNIGDSFDGEGFTPAPAAVPQSVTPRQAKLALLNAGLLANVESAIDAIEDATEKAAARIEWDFALEFRRDNALLNSIGTALGLTSGQIDDLFGAAAAL